MWRQKKKTPFGNGLTGAHRTRVQKIQDISPKNGVIFRLWTNLGRSPARDIYPFANSTPFYPGTNGHTRVSRVSSYLVLYLRLPDYNTRVYYPKSHTWYWYSVVWRRVWYWAVVNRFVNIPVDRFYPVLPGRSGAHPGTYIFGAIFKATRLHYRSVLSNISLTP